MCKPTRSVSSSTTTQQPQQQQTKTIAAKSSPSPRKKSFPPSAFFRNKHGLSGLVSTITTCLAISMHWNPPSSSPPSSPLATVTTLMAISSSLVTSSSGMTIVDQAPKHTVIMTSSLIYIIPPHRDAFKRTAYSIYYICARILWNITAAGGEHTTTTTTTSSSSFITLQHWVYGCGAVLYATIYFLPRFSSIDWMNGNTYIFMIPMGCGLFVDALFQLPIIQCHHHHHHSNSGNSINNNNEDEEEVVCWNSNIITQLDLLLVLLSGLIVAFAFTLAFRNVLTVRHCYWYSALVVHGIVGYLIMKAMTYVALLF